MKIYYNFNSVLTIVWFYITIEGALTFDLQKILDATNFCQITSFVSNDFRKNSNLKWPLFPEFPNKIYSFSTNNQNLVNHNDENALKNMYSLQESLIVFYTIKSNEIVPFIDFLVPQLSIRQRPRCLIIFSSNSFSNNDELDIVNASKYAWKKKFLDFLVIKSSLTYHYNPFHDTVYRKERAEHFVAFPDKLKDGHEYPINIPDDDFHNFIVYIKLRDEKVRMKVHPYFAVDLTAKILNLKIVSKKVTPTSAPRLPNDLLEKWNLDIHPYGLMDVNYSSYFLIPTDHKFEDVVAFVPIIPTSEIDVFLKILYNVVILLVIISSFLLTYNVFQNAVGQITIYDIVLLLLGQSAKREPKKTVESIIFMTVVVTSFIIMNDTLSDIILIMFEKNDVPFESYKDLYNSGLQTYTNIDWLKDLQFIDELDEPYLMKILKRTLVVDYHELVNCFDTMSKWKNVSCIGVPHDEELTVSINQNPDGSDTIKVAQPLILRMPLTFYWFADGSPFATKFREILVRINEGSLMHWPALVDKNRSEFVNINGTRKVTTDDVITSQQLLIILSFGLSLSIMTFIIELIVSKIEKTDMTKYCRYVYVCLN